MPNDICAAAILLAFAAALLAGPQRRLRLLAAAAIGLTALTIAILRTRTGVMVVVAELAALSLIWRRALLWLLPAGLAVAAADQWIGAHTIEKLLFDYNMDNHGVAGRLGLWAAAWGMFETAPWFGHGAQSFGGQHAAYMPAWAPRFPERHVMWAHSLYLETLAEQGVAGIAALALLLLHPLSRLCHMIVITRREALRRIDSVCALAGLVGFLVAAGFEVSFIRRWVAVVLFGLLGFAMRVVQQGEPGQPFAPRRIE